MPAKPPRRARRTKRLALGALLAIALLAAGGHSLLWLRVCDQLEEGFAAWVAVPPEATSTSTPSCTSSPASAGSRE